MTEGGADKANKLLERGKYKEAADIYTAIPKEKLSEEDNFNLALCYAGLARQERDKQKMNTLNGDAIRILLEMRKGGSTFPYIDFTLGSLFEKQNDIPKAIWFYRKGLQHRETYEDAKEAYDFLSQQKEIDEESDKLIELKPFKSKISFKDVMGLKGVKAKLFSKVILPLQKPELIREYTDEYSTGILLYGSAGNGKTMLARAIAGEANSYMIVVKIRQIEGQYVGITEKNVGALFEQARMNAPCIIFIDEAEVLLGKRSNYSGSDEHGGTNTLKQAVNAFLEEMDGIEKNPEGIMIIAATNRPWDIDPAMLREGRFGTTIYVPPPNKSEREAAFKYNLSKKRKVANRISYGRLARATEGFSQSDIKGICKNATEMAYMQKNTTGEDVPISLGKLLIATKDYKTSSLTWFEDAKKELLGTYQTQIIDRKKHQIWKSAKLDPLEQMQYKELIKDIKKNASTKGKSRMKELRRSFALYIA